MEFNISSSDLLKGLTEVSKAIPAKTTNNIIDAFLLVLDGSDLHITATDQEFTMHSVIKTTSSDGKGGMVVPWRTIMDLLKTLPDQPISVKSTSDSAFEVSWSNGNSSLSYYPVADYPEIKSLDENAQKLVFPSSVLFESIDYTAFAAANDEMRPVMNGLFFDMSGEGTNIVASDAQKLVAYTTKDVRVAEAASFILPKKAATVLKSSLEKIDEEVELRFDSNSVEFKFSGTQIISRLIVGKFPDYRKVIPQNNANILKIDRNQLLNAVRRVAVCANKASNFIKFELKPSQLEISAQDFGFALAAYEKLDCDYRGDEFTIGFKHTHIIEMLSNMHRESVELKFGDARRAALVIPSEEEEESGKICGILMPVVVS